MAYLLGLLSWIPVAIVAVLTGRLLAAVQEAETRPVASKAAPAGPDPVRSAAAAVRAPELFDDWSFAWDDLR